MGHSQLFRIIKMKSEIFLWTNLTMKCQQDKNNRNKCQSVQPADLLMVQTTVHEIHGPKIKYTESLFLFYLRPDDKIKLKI